jgi:hypothetical protein
MRFVSSASERKRNKALRGALRPLGRRLRQARSAQEMWPIVVEAGIAVGAVAVRLRSEVDPDGTTSFSHGFGAETGTAVPSVRFLVPGGKGADRVLELSWPDGRSEVDRDTEIAIDIFCEHLGDALETWLVPALASHAVSALKPRA